MRCHSGTRKNRVELEAEGEAGESMKMLNVTKALKTR